MGWTKGGLALAKCRLLLAACLAVEGAACSSTPSEVGGTAATALSSGISSDRCKRDDDCVSGLCRAEHCALCNTLTFETDSAEHPLAHGKVLENAYSPAHLDILRKHGERGLAVAYKLGTGPSSNNVLISQALFTEQEVLNEQVATASPDPSKATLRLQFPAPVCLRSFEEIHLKEHRHEHGDPHSCGSNCGGKKSGDSSTIDIRVDAGEGIDSVQVCGSGSPPLGSGSSLGQECGVPIIDYAGPPVADPCQSGVEIGTLKLRKKHGLASLALNVPGPSTLCIKVQGAHVKSLSLDGAPLRQPRDQPVRSVVAGGNHELTIEGHGHGGGVEVDVFGVPGVFDSRTVVRDDGLTLSSTDEAPDVVPQGGTSKLSALVSVERDVRCDDGLTLEYEFRIYSPTTCTLVRSIKGQRDVDAGATTEISASWDGNDAAGQHVPDGDYLWSVEVDLKRSSGHGRHKKNHGIADVTSGFRRIRIWGQVDANDCRDAVRAAVQAAGLVEGDSRFDVIRNLLRCGADTPSGCEIDYFTLVNLQRKESALAIMSDSVSPAQYLALQFDRTRKVRFADTDPSWLPAFCAGDGDRDLVPDSFDHCPDTPPLTPTDDMGCTNTTLPPSPDPGDVRRMLDGTKIAAAPACPRGAKPRGSSVLTATQTNDRSLRVVFRKESGVPEGCPVWYELQGEIEIVAGTNTAAFRARQTAVGVVGPGLTPVASTATTVTYDIAPEDLGFGQYSGYEFFDWYELEVVVNTIIGNGSQSPDSAINQMFVLN